jgi:hypothetical protein
VLRWNEKTERIKDKVQYIAFAFSFSSYVGDALKAFYSFEICETLTDNI